MPISYTYNLVFIHIPKCAGTTVEKIIGTSTPDEYFSSWKNIQKGKLKTSQHFTYLELKNDLDINWDEFFVFSIVRNPYARFVSEYNYRRHIFLKSNDPKSDVGSFLQFANMLKMKVHDRVKRFDGHLETQSSYLNNKNNEIEKSINVFKMEDMSICWNVLEQKTGVCYKHNYWSRKSIYKKPFQNFYTREIKKIISIF